MQTEQNTELRVLAMIADHHTERTEGATLKAVCDACDAALPASTCEEGVLVRAVAGIRSELGTASITEPAFSCLRLRSARGPPAIS